MEPGEDVESEEVNIVYEETTGGACGLFLCGMVRPQGYPVVFFFNAIAVERSLGGGYNYICR